jgi:hypothetical protein
MFAVAALAAGLTGGCREYFDRRDTLTLEAGDAIAVNKATQTIDRWPRESGRDRWLSDGERARTAAENYRNRKVPEPSPQPGSTQSAAQPASSAE